MLMGNSRWAWVGSECLMASSGILRFFFLGLNAANMLMISFSSISIINALASVSVPTAVNQIQTDSEHVKSRARQQVLNNVTTRAFRGGRRAVRRSYRRRRLRSEAPLISSAPYIFRRRLALSRARVRPRLQFNNGEQALSSSSNPSMSNN